MGQNEKQNEKKKPLSLKERALELKERALELKKRPTDLREDVQRAGLLAALSCLALLSGLLPRLTFAQAAYLAASVFATSAITLWGFGWWSRTLPPEAMPADSSKPPADPLNKLAAPSAPGRVS